MVTDLGRAISRPNFVFDSKLGVLAVFVLYFKPYFKLIVPALKSVHTSRKQSRLVFHSNFTFFQTYWEIKINEISGFVDFLDNTNMAI